VVREVRVVISLARYAGRGEKEREEERDICNLRAHIELYVLYNVKKHHFVDVALGRG
jgi:hypothetical protein